MLGQRRTTGGGEKVSKKLDLGNGEVALGQPDCQPMLLTEDKDLWEVVNVRGKIRISST